MKEPGGPRGMIGAHSSRNVGESVTFVTGEEITTGEVTLMAVWAAVRSRLVCCAVAQYPQQSILQELPTDVVFFGLNPE